MTDRTDDGRTDRDRGTEDATDAGDEFGEPERQERTAQRDSASEERPDRDPAEGDTHRQRPEGSEPGRQHRSEQAGPDGTDAGSPDATETAATPGAAGGGIGQEPTREAEVTDDEDEEEDPVPDAETGDRSGGGLEHDQDRLRDESGGWTKDEDDGDRER